jgi:RimJ/RimL family protein N-acetyltransferase
MKEADLHEFGRVDTVRSLFEGFDYSLSISALVEGNNPGRIFVDDVAQPRTALALTVEGTLLAGDDTNPTTNEALRQLFKESIFTDKVFVEDDWGMMLAVHPQRWEAKLTQLIPTHQADVLPRYHYRCREVKLHWRDHLPDGYTVHQIDRALLANPVLTVPAAILETIATYWRAVDHFLAKGAGFCVVHQNEAVSWCIADCTAGNQIDVGIMTVPAHRRRGLAAVAAAATVEYCLSHGFTSVGWHCDQDNVASWKTAEKVGFQRTREYVYYYYIFSQPDHFAQLARSCFNRGDYERTVQYLEQAFALRADHPDYYYVRAAEAWGALGNREMALKYLNRAIDRGWTDLRQTSQMESFHLLHGTAEWKAILARMQKDTR